MVWIPQVGTIVGGGKDLYDGITLDHQIPTGQIPREDIMPKSMSLSGKILGSAGGAYLGTGGVVALGIPTGGFGIVVGEGIVVGPSWLGGMWGETKGRSLGHEMNRLGGIDDKRLR